VVTKTNAFFAGLLLVACARTPSPAKVEAQTDASTASTSTGAGVGVGATASGSSPAATSPSDGDSCKGDATKGVTCKRFATAEDAFKSVVADDLQVLAVGESHAQKGTEALTSATKRFTERLLPAISSRSGDLVVELWHPDPKCMKEVKATAQAQKPVTETQATTNVNEYDALAIQSKSLGVTPWPLRPTCDDFSSIADAGADAVPVMLGLVKRLTQQKVQQLMAKNVPAKKLTIAYGGLAHNDVAPAAASAAWSFGPDLVKASGGKYVEIDLIVPEYVKDSDIWKKLAWYDAFSADAGPREKATLYTMATTPPSYALVFASSSGGPSKP
jgi:hypothetical protein